MTEYALTVFESAVAIISVIGLVSAGVIIGREFGTFQDFVINVLENLERKLRGKRHD